MRKLNIQSLLLLCVIVFHSMLMAGQYTFSVKGEKTYLNDQEIIVKGLRLSNALISDESTHQTIAYLDTFKYYGMNTISVFFMGSRFGDIKGYNEDATLNPVYAERMARIIKAADQRGMIVLVGCLYWSTSAAKWESWEQKDANKAVANTVAWLKDYDFKNVFVDVDNEGMAHRGKGFDVGELIRAGKKVNPDCIMASNYHGDPIPEEDLRIHFSKKIAGKPYIESEGTPTNAPGGYWGTYSKRDGYYNYINIGVYTREMKKNQISISKQHFDNGDGYMLASTWLQCVEPYGPNQRPGGYGYKVDPGIRWWLEFVQDNYGPYIEPALPGTPVYEEKNGTLSIEAESFIKTIDRKPAGFENVHSWQINNDKSGFSGDGFVQILPDEYCEGCDGPRSPRDASGAELVWRIKINTEGIYHIWIRGMSMGGESNGCHIGVDGVLPYMGPGSNISGFRPHNEWVWENKYKHDAQQPKLFLSKGEHTLHLWQRDDGFRCDKIVLVNDKSFKPVGTGPDMSIKKNK